MIRFNRSDDGVGATALTRERVSAVRYRIRVVDRVAPRRPRQRPMDARRR